MHALKELLHLDRGGSRYTCGLDLGDGRTLPPEDVLDGHSIRLLADRRGGTHTVPVRVHDDLSAAITVMAPDLAPLADLAEEVADVVPAVAPEPDFRRNLYKALERTHQQYRIQEALGTRAVSQGGSNRMAVVLTILAIVICTFGVAGWLVLRRNRKYVSN